MLEKSLYDKLLEYNFCIDDESWKLSIEFLSIFDKSDISEPILTVYNDGFIHFTWNHINNTNCCLEIHKNKIFWVRNYSDSQIYVKELKSLITVIHLVEDFLS